MSQARQLIPKDRGDRLPGHWTPASIDGKDTAGLTCPRCGRYGTIGDHEIAADGTVSPSVECPAGCGYHEHITLEGWPPP